MAEFPALPLFTDAYLGDTTHLSTFEHGAYLLLLMVAWRSPGCRLADDDALLARYTRMTRDKWRKTRPILAPFFRIGDGFWHQARLQDEFQHLQSQRETQRKAGRASAGAKALKRTNRGSTAVGDPLQRNVNGTPTPTPTPTTLAKANGVPPDSDAQFWATAKTYLGEAGVKNPGAVVGKWIRDHGKDSTASALTRAQLERAVEPVPFVEGCFRAKGRPQDAWVSPC